MRAAGDVENATADREDLPDPLVLPAEADLPSRELARLRRNER